MTYYCFFFAHNVLKYKGKLKKEKNATVRGFAINAELSVASIPAPPPVAVHKYIFDRNFTKRCFAMNFDKKKKK